MLFSQPISKRTQPTYSEGTGLASVRDSRNTPLLWKKARPTTQQGLADNNSLASIRQQLNQLKRRQVGYDNRQLENFYPFKIYQPDQSWLQTTTGNPIIATTFDAIGTPSQCNIDSTKPTDFTATPPTVNPNTDYWRLWLVRDGLVEIRPYFSSISFYEGNNSSVLQDVYYGTDLFTPFNGIGVPYDSQPDSSSVTFSFFNTNGLASGFPDQYLYGGVLVMSGDLPTDPTEYPTAAIWVEITPDTNDAQTPLTRIKMAEMDVSSNPPSVNPFVIPIGRLTNFGDGNGNYPADSWFVAQVFNGSILNRWGASMYCSGGLPPTQAGLYTSVSGSMNYRGDWDNDTITDQIFYPGDVVKQLVSGSEALYMQTTVAFTSDPSSDPNFIQVYYPT